MEKIKKSSVAGTFYPVNVNELTAMLNSFETKSLNKCEYKTRVVISPHAGLVYSGQLAYDVISQLDTKIKTIFIIAPVHKVPVEGCVLSSYDKWETPLGLIELNKKIISELNSKFNFEYNDEAFVPEHSVEVEIPFIQTLFKKVKVVPILVGRDVPAGIQKIFDAYYDNPENGFIISSDLSHFLSDDKAVKLDAETAEMIETGNIVNFKYKQACGAIGISGLVNFANSRGFSLIRTGLYNSSVSSGNKESVVGYGGWFLYEGQTMKFIKEYYSPFIIDLCKNVIASYFDKKQRTINFPNVFSQKMSTFVTLKKNGLLRGCIGSVVAYQPLINDIVHNASAAAFQDPRFNPVSKDEVKDLEISVSILTHPKKMEFSSEGELLDKIEAGKDGLIIRVENHQAVYIPSVWEEIPDKVLFLNSLKVKAGLDYSFFSRDFEAYKFQAEYIS